MKYESKFNLGQKVFFMADNKVHTGEVAAVLLAHRRVDQHRIGLDTLSFNYALRADLDNPDNQTWAESTLFASKEDLLNSL
jgi:hypothetical protein